MNIMAVNPKGIEDYLNDDKTLKSKITFEEFENKKNAPSNTDVPLEEAYASYQRVLEYMKTEV